MIFNLHFSFRPGHVEQRAAEHNRPRIFYFFKNTLFFSIRFSGTAQESYKNASVKFGEQFKDVFHRTNDSMTTYKDIPWEHLTLSECKM